MLKEVIGPYEQQLLDATLKIILAGQESGYEPGTVAGRQVHRKSHGLYKGVFKVLSRIPASAKIGLFARSAQQYEVEIRPSNGLPGPDALPNVIGWAMKLKGVAGAKLLPGEENSEFMDFLLSNHPYFFIKNPEDYPPIQTALGEITASFAAHAYRQGLKKGLQFVAKFPRTVLLAILSTVKVVKNPFEIDVFSQTAYALGANVAVKHGLFAKQRRSFTSLFPNIFDPSFRKHNAEKMLKKGPAKFTFAVQFQTEGDSLEDPTVAWKGPWVPVAELVIYEALENDGEALSFNPWRTLAEHRPLGWSNRFRKIVYPADFKWRTDKNAARPRCPFSGK